jgi:hypothetical protein
MNHIDRIIEKHRSVGLLIDANLLLLYVLGITNKSRITTFKRTQKYTVDDFELLSELVDGFRKIVTTPNVLTEVSNLETLHGIERQQFRIILQRLTESIEERYIESRRATSNKSFARLGITDATISVLGEQGFLVLTDDHDLYQTLCSRQVDAVNFNHVRGLV